MDTLERFDLSDYDRVRIAHALCEAVDYRIQRAHAADADNRPNAAELHRAVAAEFRKLVDIVGGSRPC